jgi:hypothetical protein
VFSKYVPQNFAKSLLDVADNLGRASSVVKGNFSKIDVSNDTAQVVPLLKTLLEGVEMTEKQLGEVSFLVTSSAITSPHLTAFSLCIHFALVLNHCSNNHVMFWISGI